MSDTKQAHEPQPVSIQNLDVLLQRAPHLLLRFDTPKGRGVFTTHPIPAGTTIEVCPVLVLDPEDNTKHIEKTALYHYTYNWPYTTNANSKSKTTQAVVLGLGSMFNHSTLHQNVGWIRDVQRQVITYRALRDIQAGEELCISYGDRLTFVDADETATRSGMLETQEDGEGLDKIEWE